MDWKTRAPYRGFQIWVGQLRGGAWVGSVATLPESGVGFTAGPGEQCAPGEYDSEEAAVEATKRYIDEKRSRRAGIGQMTLDEAKELIFGRLCRRYTERSDDPYMEPDALRIELGIPEELFAEAIESLREAADLYIAYDTAKRRIKLGSSWRGRCEDIRRP